MRWNRAEIDPATRQIYMKGPPLYNLILHTEWKELKVCGVVLGFSSELVGCSAKFAEGGPSILEILNSGLPTMK